jgi:hypothetical protein
VGPNAYDAIVAGVDWDGQEFALVFYIEPFYVGDPTVWLRRWQVDARAGGRPATHLGGGLDVDSRPQRGSRAFRSSSPLSSGSELSFRFVDAGKELTIVLD